MPFYNKRQLWQFTFILRTSLVSARVVSSVSSDLQHTALQCFLVKVIHNALKLQNF